MTGEAGRLREQLVKRDSGGRTGKEPVGLKAFRVDIGYRNLSKISSSPLAVERKREEKKICED